MRVSVAFSGFGGLAETVPIVMAAERHGLDGVWTAEHLGFHDAVVPSALYLAKTERIEIGLVGLSTASRHPGLTAMELMSMSELAPGRVRCQVGLGDASLVAKLGHTQSKPIASTTAFVNSLRETFQGRDMKVSYPEFTFDGFRLAPLGPVPAIDVMAIRPKMVEVATRVGDGLSISIGASSAYLRDVVADVERGLAEAGRDRSSFRITALAMAAIGDDLEAIRAPIGPMMSTFPQASAAFLARGVVDAEELLSVEREDGPMGVMKMWTAERGRPDRIRLDAGDARRSARRIRRHGYRRTGVDDDQSARRPAQDRSATRCCSPLMNAAQASPNRRWPDRKKRTMTTQDAISDEAAIKELHDGFVEANKTGYHPFLEAHMAPGMQLVWYNLNQSNYHGVDHIVDLWKMLVAMSQGREAKCVSRDDEITMIGDVGLVTYLLDFNADFGSLGKFVQEARCTEVWQRMDGAWKMIHFHCSNYVPGVMGGK